MQTVSSREVYRNAVQHLRVTRSQFVAMVRSGEVADAATVAAHGLYLLTATDGGMP